MSLHISACQSACNPCKISSQFILASQRSHAGKEDASLGIAALEWRGVHTGVFVLSIWPREARHKAILQHSCSITRTGWPSSNRLCILPTITITEHFKLSSFPECYSFSLSPHHFVVSPLPIWTTFHPEPLPRISFKCNVYLCLFRQR